MERQAEPQQHGVAPARMVAQAGQRAEDQATGNGGHAAAPVGVHPLVERAELDGGQQPAQEGPTGRGPTAQHPVAQGAEGGHGEHHAGPGRAEERPAEGQHEALAQRIDRAVRGLLEDEEGFEKPVHGMRRIGQPEMTQRIGRQQVTEFVVDFGAGNGVAGQQQEAQGNRQRRPAAAGTSRSGRPGAPRKQRAAAARREPVPGAAPRARFPPGRRCRSRRDW